MVDERAFPTLFETTELPGAPVDATFALLGGDETERPIASVYVVAFTGRQCVMARLESGEYALLGGTLEPGEDHLAALRRELLEEAGAHLLGYTPFACLDCHARDSRPLRPHLPHPDYRCLLGHGGVELVCPPRNPAGSEHVVDVFTAPVEEAAELLAVQDQAWEADLHRLAAHLRQAG